MLVLSRKKNQTILIDGQIEIEVLQIKGSSIRLGIKAPTDVRVLRGELKPFGMADSSDQTHEFAGNFMTEIEAITAKAG